MAKELALKAPSYPGGVWEVVEIEDIGGQRMYRTARYAPTLEHALIEAGYMLGRPAFVPLAFAP